MRTRESTRPQRGPLLGLSIVAIVAIQLIVASAAPAPAAARELEFVKPGPDRLVTGRGKVTVVLHTARKLRKLQVRLDGKGVRKSFKRVRRGVWRAKIARRRLRVGRNHLVASTVHRTGHRDYVSSRFVLGKRRKGYLKLRVRRRVASSAVAKVHMRSLPNLRFRAKLNGRGVAKLFRRSYLPNRTAHLGADDGLRFGRNVLRVVAARGNGTFDFERRVIFVRRDRPLVGAGPDRLTSGRHRVVLRERRSRAGRLAAPSGGARAQAENLRYRWKVVRRPKGSHAKPVTPRAARTRFRPDVVGTYRLALTVTDGAGLRGSDVVTVTDVANAPPIGLPIETLLRSGEEFWMEVGGERVGLPLHAEFSKEQHEWVAALFLDRLTLEVLHAENYNGSEAEAGQLEEEIDRYGQNALVVLYQPYPEGPYRAADPAFADAVSMLGVKAPPQLTEFGYSAIGVPGSGEGGMLVAGTNWERPSAGRLRGYLARDSSGLFSYVPSTSVAFDTSAPGAPQGMNRIEVGGTIYESEPLTTLCPQAQGGFQIAAFYAETLEPVLNFTFPTNGCGAHVDALQLSEGVLGILRELEAQESPSDQAHPLGRESGDKLVVVQTIGSPRDPAAGAQWSELAPAMQRLGATEAVFEDATASYALVGSVATFAAEGIERFPLTEASQSQTGSPARITGVLEPNDLGSYVPFASSPTGTVSFDLAEIALQPAQPWPYSETPGEKAVLKYVAGLLDLPQPTAESSCYVPPQPDVRSEYCNEKVRGEWAGYVGQVRGAQCDGTCQRENEFSQEDWEDVTAELVGRGHSGEFFEFNAVQSTWELIRSLQTPFGASGVNAEVDLNKLSTEIEQALEPPPESEATGDWLDVLDTILYTASYVDDPAAPVIGALAGALGVGSLFVDGPEGSPRLAEFEIEAADVAVELAERLEAGSERIATVGELLVSDYGKLKAVAEDPTFAGFTPKTIEGATGSLETGTKQWIYQTLLGAAYEAVSLEPGTSDPELNNPLPETAGSFECTYAEANEFGEFYERYLPFKASASAQYFDASPARTLGVLVERGSKLPERKGPFPGTYPESPPASLFEPVYKPISEGGLGLYVPWFWREAFGFPGPGVKTISC